MDSQARRDENASWGLSPSGVRPHPSFLACALLVLLLAGPAGAEDAAFDPARTHALIIGVLEWKDRSLASFSAKGRKDRVLHETLVARGVAKERTRLLLDRQATLGNILKALDEVLAAVGKNDTLIVYYAGHGTVAEDVPVTFLEYDYDGTKPEVSGLTVARLSQKLVKGFSGRRLLLFADCCHSGGMAHVAAAVRKAKPSVQALSLTSAEDSNESTGNWTFTLSLIDGLRGVPHLDTNADGAVTFAELSEEVRGAMKHRERQRHGFSRQGVPHGFRLAPTRGKHQEKSLPGPFARGEYVRVLQLDGTRIGRVCGAEGKAYRVQLQGYADRELVTKPARELERLTYERYEAGTKVRVLWEDRLWDARVVRRDGDFHRITYPGWPPVWDEWVLSDRIQPPGLDERKARERARCGGRYSRLLKRIEVIADVANYGLFCEEGYFDADSWAGHENLPHGHWVYVYPHWYIWRDRKLK